MCFSLTPYQFWNIHLFWPFSDFLQLIYWIPCTCLQLGAYVLFMTIFAKLQTMPVASRLNNCNWNWNCKTIEVVKSPAAIPYKLSFHVSWCKSNVKKDRCHLHTAISVIIIYLLFFLYCCYVTPLYNLFAHSYHVHSCSS